MADFPNRLKILRKQKDLTQQQLAEEFKKRSTEKTFSASAIGMWERGERIPHIDILEIIADYFNVDMNYLLGKSSLTSRINPITHEIEHIDPLNPDAIVHSVQIDNLYSLETKRVPLLGEIACGEPRFIEDEYYGYVDVDASSHADFCLRAKGDSMIGARIEDGDLVFIRAQDDVENGEIAAVIIEDEATLKRVDKSVPGYLLLRPDNPNYEQITINLAEKNDDNFIKIIGKAVAFQGKVK